MLNSIGLENVGIALPGEKLPVLRALGWTVVASPLGGETAEELERLLADLADEPGIAGFEINFLVSQRGQGRLALLADARRLEATLARLRPLRARH
jgi:hypothetical protein